ILRSGLLSLTPLLILGITPHTARAATINVPAGQPTILAAINAASNGDTVLVAPGTYYENIYFLGKAITVTSSGGPSVTTINGGVAFTDSEGRNSVLSGFTITNGTRGGIYMYYASPTISGNVITGNLDCGGGGGIVAEFSSALIQGNIITNNGEYPNPQYPDPSCGGYGGGGILVLWEGSVQIIGNTISGKSWSG